MVKISQLDKMIYCDSIYKFIISGEILNVIYVTQTYTKKETEMSDPSYERTPTLSGLMVRYASKWMAGRETMLSKIDSQIKATNSKKKLKKLRKEQNQALVNGADIQQLDKLLGKLLKMGMKHKKAATKLQELGEKADRKAAQRRNPAHGH